MGDDARLTGPSSPVTPLARFTELRPAPHMGTFESVHSDARETQAPSRRYRGGDDHGPDTVSRQPLTRGPDESRLEPTAAGP